MKNVTLIGDVRIYDNVTIGEGGIVYGPAILGQPPRGKAEGELPLIIGARAVIRPFTTIYAGNVIGDDFQTGQGSSIREDNYIGNRVSVGTHAILEYENRIDDDSRVHSGCFLEMVTLGRNVFVGPHTVFTDDPHPMNCPKWKECGGGAVVADLVKIGANCTFLPAVKIGRGALIGAGSVVVGDIPEGMVAAGNPARVIKPVSKLTCRIGAYERVYSWPPYENSGE
ncbi:MAG: N-acetyltransferase [candidate division Zixibacteria bacterium]|nr:N-acetyltransferase [candidate division Zixibacteria bacterium]